MLVIINNAAGLDSFRLVVFCFVLHFKTKNNNDNNNNNKNNNNNNNDNQKLGNARLEQVLLQIDKFPVFVVVATTTKKSKRRKLEEDEKQIR